MPTSWEDMALIWQKETKPNRQGKLPSSHSHSVSPMWSTSGVLGGYTYLFRCLWIGKEGGRGVWGREGGVWEDLGCVEKGQHAGASSSFINPITQIPLCPSCWTRLVKHLASCTEAPMHGHGPGQRARLTPSKKVGLVLEKRGAGRGVYLAAWELQLRTRNYLAGWNCFPLHPSRGCKGGGYTTRRD